MNDEARWWERGWARAVEKTFQSEDPRRRRCISGWIAAFWRKSDEEWADPILRDARIANSLEMERRYWGHE